MLKSHTLALSGLIRSRGSTGLTWLGGGALVALFMTDWRAVMGYVPFVRGKFPPIETTDKKKAKVAADEEEDDS